MGQIYNIIEGWTNYFKGKTSKEELRRSEHCVVCPYAVIGTYEQLMPDFELKEIQGLKCDSCGCPLSTKLRSKNENCPIGKW